MKVNKKGQGLSLQMVIIAVILLVVLGVTIYIFTSKFGKTAQEVDSCASKGGVCRASCKEGEASIGKYDCPDSRVDRDGNNWESKVFCCYNLSKEE